MELSNEQVYSAYNALQTIAGQQLPVDTALQVRRAMKALEPEYEPLDETRQEIIEEHAERDGQGNIKQNDRGGIPLKDPDAANEAMEELWDGEVEIDVDPIPFEALGEVSISAGALDILLEAGIVEE